MKITVYDKANWHLNEQTSQESVANQLSHLRVIMNWLEEKNLLSDEGKEIFELGIDQEFSLTSAMVTPLGEKVLNEAYKEWVEKFKLGAPNLDILTKYLEA